MARRGRIFVAAGTNGAGKSTIAGQFLARAGGAYYNPDERTRALVAAGLDPTEANARSWADGYDRLRYAIANGERFAFETTLGGRSICRELHRAAEVGVDVCIWYVGLVSPELHIERVRARVARGGHAIPEAKIRERYKRSLANLIGLIGVATEIQVFDNSEESADGNPRARRIFRMKGSRIVAPSVEVLLRSTPDWAKPVAAAAIGAHAKARKVRARRK